MSRKQYTTATVTIKAPIPPGMTQAQFVEAIKTWATTYFGQSAIVRLTGKETTYL